MKNEHIATGMRKHRTSPEENSVRKARAKSALCWMELEIAVKGNMADLEKQTSRVPLTCRSQPKNCVDMSVVRVLLGWEPRRGRVKGEGEGVK
jgi:hypothetical protein